MTSFAGVSAAKRQGIVQVKKSGTLRGSIVRESEYFQMGVGLYSSNFNGIAAVEDESDPPFLASWFVGPFCAMSELVVTSLFARQRPLGRLRGIFESVDIF